VPHVLIAGAAGFVGGACTRGFLSKGWRVTAIIRRTFPRCGCGIRLSTKSAPLSHELDFSGDRFEELLASCGLAAVTHAEGVEELRAWARSAPPLVDKEARSDVAPVAD
jgi:nucleoside-diphosphate-sugar epimerase